MKTPKKKDIIKYFENAETVECVIDSGEYILDLTKPIQELNGRVRLLNQRDVPFTGYRTYCCLWSKEKGYAKILSYKEPKEETFQITKEQIELLVDVSKNAELRLKEWFPKVFEITTITKSEAEQKLKEIGVNAKII